MGKLITKIRKVNSGIITADFYELLEMSRFESTTNSIKTLETGTPYLGLYILIDILIREYFEKVILQLRFLRN